MKMSPSKDKRRVGEELHKFPDRPLFSKKKQPFGWVSFFEAHFARKLLLSGSLIITSESSDPLILLVDSGVLHFPSTGFTSHDIPDVRPEFFAHFRRGAASPVSTADMRPALVQYFFFCLGPHGKTTVFPEISAA
jgi:hypothetical protein